MGRKQRRSDERRIKGIVNEEQIDTSIKLSTLVKIVFFIVLILFVLYYVLAVFVTKEIDISSKDNSTSENSTDTTNISNKILASSIFDQKESTYYVYFYDFSNEDESISGAINNRSDLTIYRVDTSSSLNNKYVTDSAGNRNVTSKDNLKVKNPTLIEVTNDKVTKYYEGTKEIIDFLG